MILDKNIITNNENETILLGKSFAEDLKKSDIVLFTGELGAGKTEFIKGICSFFKVEEYVTSPTFTIINQYFGTDEFEGLIIYHIDLYRIKNEKELLEIGISEFLEDESSIKLIEWADKVLIHYPKNVYRIDITQGCDNENQRNICITKQ